MHDPRGTRPSGREGLRVVKSLPGAVRLKFMTRFEGVGLEKANLTSLSPVLYELINDRGQIQAQKNQGSFTLK